MLKRSVMRNVFTGLIFVCAAAGAAFAQTTVFTYQGKLTDSGTPQATYQMEFSLFGSPGGEDQIGATVTNPNVAVNQGVFTVNLDFGAPAFDGADKFLQISIRRSASESFVTLSPRQQITSSPYSIRTLSAAQADVALDSNKLGGVDASEYVTTTTVGNSFIKNATTQQTADFNVSGSGVVGGSLGLGGVPQAGQRLDVTGASVFRTANGNVNLGTPNGETGMSIVSGGRRADLRFDGFSLRLLSGLGVAPPSATNGITINGVGNVGIGTFPFTSKLEIEAQDALAIRGFQPFMTFTDTNANLRSRLQAADGGFVFFTNNNLSSGNPAMAVSNSGNVGIGMNVPPTRLAISGGPLWSSNQWTGSLSLGNASALGWEANASGQRFGIGQSTGGLYFFRTNSAFGNTGSPATIDMGITDTGNITQARDKGGLVKAMIRVNPFLPADQYIVHCYNGMTNSSTGNCGFSMVRLGPGNYSINFGSGFQVIDRFFSLTFTFTPLDGGVDNVRTGQVRIAASLPTFALLDFVNGDGDNADSAFYLIVY
jgi:hypothetical protein